MISLLLLQWGSSGGGTHIFFLYGDVPLNRVSFSAFALREYDLNCLDGNISTFSYRFLTNFQGRAQFCLKKLKDRVLFKNLSLRDRVSFSGI